MRNQLFPFFILFLLLESCISESTNLGDNFAIMYGDNLKDRAVVYCTGYSGHDCIVGTLIIPTYSLEIDKEGHYQEYLEEAKANKKWIIAKTKQIKLNKERYWLLNKDHFYHRKRLDCDTINCDSLIQSQLIGPLNRNEFIAKKQSLKIDLNF